MYFPASIYSIKLETFQVPLQLLTVLPTPQVLLLFLLTANVHQKTPPRLQHCLTSGKFLLFELSSSATSCTTLLLAPLCYLLHFDQVVNSNRTKPQTLFQEVHNHFTFTGRERRLIRMKASFYIL